VSVLAHLYLKIDDALSTGDDLTFQTRNVAEFDLLLVSVYGLGEGVQQESHGVFVQILNSQIREAARNAPCVRN